MTEDEAKTKWCPYSRYQSHSLPAANRWKQSQQEDEPHALNPVPCRCLGSACMAWRWLPLMADDAFKMAIIKAAKDIGDTTENKHKAAKHVTENRALYGLPVEPFDGFCGLAGKP